MLNVSAALVIVRRFDSAKRGKHLADEVDAPAGHQSHRSFVGMSGFSLQFGLTSTHLPVGRTCRI